MNITQWDNLFFTVAGAMLAWMIKKIIQDGNPAVYRAIIPSFTFDQKQFDRLHERYLYRFLPCLEVVLITGTGLVEMIKFLDSIPEFNFAAFCFCLFMTAICGIASFIFLMQRCIVSWILSEVKKIW